MPEKHYLGKTVLDAAKERISWTFDIFPRVLLSFSGGKDSTVMMHLVMQEAQRRNRKVGVLFVDLEGQYQLTIEHSLAMYEQYKAYIEPYWVCVPIKLRNAVSNYEPKWMAWDPSRQPDWIRNPPAIAITDKNQFEFFKHVDAMEFEEFVPKFGAWYAQEELLATFVGIRTGESLNRWRTIAGHGTKFEGRNWTNHVIESVWNIYPIYDWTTEDIWTYHAVTKLPYNRLYDRMHQAGLTIHQQRICQPYGDDQRKGLWLFQVIEPETWGRIVARVNGANQGALYAKTSGNILGRLRIDKPEGHTWESFATLLLESMPSRTAEHYKNKIAIFIQYYKVRGYPDGIPDEQYDPNHPKGGVSWKRVCKTLLRNDYWCKGLGFSPQTGTADQQYRQLMAKRRNLWGIYPLSE